MTITISSLKDEDVDGAITAIQVSFANDPYNQWVYNDREKVKFSSKNALFTANIRQLNLVRNRVSLGIRCRWGIQNALFYVAKDPESDEPNKVLGIAMWMPPKPAGEKETWSEWYEGWKMWGQQVCVAFWPSEFRFVSSISDVTN